MASTLRAFLFAPARRAHAADLAQLQGVVKRLSAATLIDAAYRRSGGRLTAFLFAQGVVVGAMGNLFASALGHFVDRGAQAFAWPDAAWILIGCLSLGLIVLMTIGALRRYRQNAEVEAVLVGELHRRGGASIDDAADPEELMLFRDPGA